MASESTTITTAPDGTTTIMTDGGTPHVAAQMAIDGGSFAVGAVAALLAMAGTKAVRRLRGRRAEDAPPPDAAAVELAALRQRTAVLERIVTDPGTRVAHEIEALR
jgi:hypothetical protein